MPNINNGINNNVFHIKNGINNGIIINIINNGIMAHDASFFGDV